VDTAELALRAQTAWFRGLVDSGFDQLTTGAGFAVSTGLASNSENGAVIGPSLLDRLDQFDALLVWLRDKAVPASVIATEQLEPDAIAVLLERDLEPDNTGNDMGRLLTDFQAGAPVDGSSFPDLHVREVIEVCELRENQCVYAEDGWWEEPGELDRHLEVAVRCGFGPGRAIRHWTAYHQQTPVGAATCFQFDDAALLVSCCVLEPWRRRGIGAALTRTSLTAAARHGAVQAVLGPSPEGYHLYHSLGFHLMPTRPNRWFYLR
jgi:GNAT superfamily N-acetyltransferase